MNENNSAKNKYYFSLLSEEAEKSIFFIKKNSFLDVIRLTPLLLTMRFQRKNKVDIYTGNIKTFYSRFIIWVFGYRNIYSFDDGIANIRTPDLISENNYLDDPSERPFSGIFFHVFNKSLLYKNIKRLLSKHFTIYQLPNVYENTYYIDLFENEFDIQSVAPTLKVLLTSALSLENYLNADEEKDFYDRIIVRYSIDLVIRHPRNETYQATGEATISKSLEIAEHQLGKLTKHHIIEVYGVLYTSVLINIPNSIYRLNIVPPSLKKDHMDFRFLFERLGIATAVV